jgi:hypothetical protein
MEKSGKEEKINVARDSNSHKENQCTQQSRDQESVCLFGSGWL